MFPDCHQNPNRPMTNDCDGDDGGVVVVAGGAAADSRVEYRALVVWDAVSAASWTVAAGVAVAIVAAVVGGS